MSDEINRSIIDRFTRLARQMKRRVGDESKGLGELTMLQMQALMYVKHHPDAKMSDLSEALGISPSSTSLLIDRLVTGHWIERVADQADRRVVYLRLVPRVKRHFQRAFTSQLSRLDQLLDTLPLNDRQELDRILAQLEGAL